MAEAGGRRRLLGGALAALGAATLAGCGLGAGSAPTAVQLKVTRDFGGQVLRSWSAPAVSGQETVMRLLMRNARVTTRYGGGFVQSIEGLSGGSSEGQPVDWFYYVNGVEAPKGAAETDVNPGDHIWWDRHNWSQTDSVPAVVGSFPEPFLNGMDGKRLPVRVECANVSGSACRTVLKRLQAADVPASLAAVSPGNEPETLRVLVGRWGAVAGSPAAQSIETGPRASGVYARFSNHGATLTLLNEGGASAHAYGAGAGLVAATRYGEEAPTWLITGTNEAGAQRAANAFDKASLANRFALVLAPSGAAEPAPAPEGG